MHGDRGQNVVTLRRYWLGEGHRESSGVSEMVYILIDPLSVHFRVYLLGQNYVLCPCLIARRLGKWGTGLELLVWPTVTNPQGLGSCCLQTKLGCCSEKRRVWILVPLQKFLYVVALLSQFSQNCLDKDATLLISILNGCVCLSVDCRDSDVEKIDLQSRFPQCSWFIFQWRCEVISIASSLLSLHECTSPF